MGNRQQSRFLALVSNGERLAELSEEAANAEDTATLQVLKTMDSISAKSQQLQTNLQSMFTETGLENMYKGILDFGNQIIQTFTNMPTIFKMPIPAIMSFAQIFISLGSSISMAWKMLQQKLQGEADLTNSKIIEQQQIAKNERSALADSEAQHRIDSFERTAQAAEQMENRITNAQRAGAAARMGMMNPNANYAGSGRNFDPENTDLDWSKFGTDASAAQYYYQHPEVGKAFWEQHSDLLKDQGLQYVNGAFIPIEKGAEEASKQILTLKERIQGMSQGSIMGLRMVGSAISMMAMSMSEATDSARLLKAGIQGIGGAMQAISYFASGNVIMAVFTGAMTIFNALSTAIETTEERMKRLNEEADKANNEYLQKKVDYKNLDNEIEKLEELKKARFDSAEANEKYLEASNSLAEKTPELISYIDSEGNAVLDLSNSYKVLADARLAAAESAVEAGRANIAKAEENRKQAEGNYQNALGEFVKAAFSAEGDFSSYINPKANLMAQDFIKSDLYQSYINNPQDLGKLLDVFKDREWDKEYTAEDLQQAMEYLNNGEKALKEASNKLVKNSSSFQDISEQLNSKEASQLNNYEVALKEVADGYMAVKNAGDDPIAKQEAAEQLFDAINNNKEILDEIVKGEIEGVSIDPQDIQTLMNAAKKAMSGKSESARAEAIENLEKLNSLRDQIYLSSRTILDSIPKTELELNKQDMLKNMPNANDIVTRYLEQQFNSITDKTEKTDFAIGQGKYAAEYDKITDALTKFYTGLPTEAGQAFNSLIENKGKYTKDQLVAKIKEETGRDLSDKKFDPIVQAIADFYTGAMNQETAAQAISERVRQIDYEKGAFKELLEGEDILGADEWQKVLDVYDNLAKQQEQGTITTTETIEALNAYAKIWQQINDTSIVPEDKIDAVSKIFEDWNDYSIPGLDSLRNSLEAAEIDPKVIESLMQFATSFAKLIPENLIMDFETLSKNIVSQTEDFEKALKSASDGMDLEEATKMADKLKVSVSDFRFEGGKYFTDDAQAIKDAYYKYNEETLAELNKQYQKERSIIIDELEHGGYTKEEKEDLQQQLTDLDTANENLQASIKQYGEYQVNAILIQNGKIEDFLKSFQDEEGKQLYTDEEISNFMATIKSGDFESLPENIKKYTSELWNVYKDAGKSVYESAINSIFDGRQLVKVDATNIEALSALLNRQDLKNGDQVWLDFANDIDSLREAILNNVKLTPETKRSLLSSLESKATELDDSAILKDVASSYEDLSYEVATKYARLLGVGSLEEFLASGRTEISVNESGQYIADYDALWNQILTNQNLTLKERNEVLASMAKQRQSQSDTAILSTIIQNRDKLNEENVAALATILGKSYEAVLKLLHQNADGTYSVSLGTLQAKIASGRVEVTDAIMDLFATEIDEIVSSITGLAGSQSKGFTDLGSMQKYITTLREKGIEINDEQASLQNVFEYNDTLRAYQLSEAGIIAHMQAMKSELDDLAKKQKAAELTGNEDKVREIGEQLEVGYQFIEDSLKQFADNIDISAYLNAEFGSADSLRVVENIAKAIHDYNAAVEALGGNVILNVDAIINALGAGGEGAVVAAQTIAELQGKTLSTSDIESLYRREVSGLVDAIDRVTAQPGEIVDAITASIIGFDNVEQLGTTGQYVVQSAENLYEAYNRLLERMAATGEATLADLNKVAALALENRDGEQKVIDALGDAANMTYTRFGEILAQEGIELTEILIDTLSEAGIIKQLGGANMAITDFKGLADLFDWEADSEQFVSAFKTYNDSLIDMNRKAERNILEEVSKLNGAKSGDWINLTQLYSKLQEAIVPDWYNGNVNLEKRPRVSAEDLIDKGWYAEIGEKGTINGTTFSWDEIIGMPEKMMVSLASITEDGLVKSYGEVKGYLQGLVNSASMQGQVDINKLKQLDEENQNLLLDIFISESNDINEAILEAEERAGDLHDRQALFEDFLNEELLEYGAQLENGVLQISDKGANIPMIMKTLADKVQEYGNLSVQEEAELLDTLNANLKSYSDAISNAINGTASNVEIQKISDWANSLGIQIDFTKTVDGLKLSQESATKLYNELKKVDYLQSQLVFKELSDSLKKNNANYKDMSSILARIKTLEEEISNIPASDARRKKYEEELALAKEIKETRSLTDPDSFNFMGNDIPDAMKGAENYWNSWGKAFKAMNEAGESGYMGITDFYNIVNEMNNLAKMSGNTLTFMGRELSGDAEDAANLIQEGMSHLANVDGSGVSVALKKFGAGFAKSAAGMQTGVKGGIKAMAESQIEMLDAMIGLLEVIVAFEGFKEIDTDGIFGLDFSEMFESAGEMNEDGETLFRSTQKVKDIADKILKMSDTNEDLKKALDEVKINGTSAREALKELNSDNLKTKDEWEKYRKITDILYKAAASGDYSTQNLTQLIKEAFGDSDEVTEVEIYGRKFAIKGDVIIEQDKNGNYVVDGQKYKDAKQAIEAQTFKQTNNLEEVVRNENGTYSGNLLVDKKYNVTVTSTLNEDGIQGEPTYSINGEGNYTREEALEKLYEKSGYDSKQDWILNSNVVAQFNMTISEIKATLGEDTNLGDLTDDLLSQLGIDVSLVNAVEAGIERAFSGNSIGNALITAITTALSRVSFDGQNFTISDIPVTAEKITVDTSKATPVFGPIIKETGDKAKAWVESKQSSLNIPNLNAKVDKVTYSAPTTIDSKAIVASAKVTGQDINAGLVEGMSDTTEVRKKALEIGSAVTNAINVAAGTHSPSTITTQTGKNLVRGLIDGLSDGEATNEAVSKATSLAQQVIDAIQKYFNEHPLSLSAGLNTPETPTPKKQSSTSAPAPAAPQTIAPVVDLSGITALQNAIAALSAAGTAAAAELGQMNANLINSTVKATNFEDALSKISDNGKIKAEEFEKALSAIGDNGKIQAEDFEKALSAIEDNGKNKANEFQKALSEISDNGKKKADDFAAALAAIKQDGVNNANNFKNAVNAVQSSGATNASNFKDAVNNTGSTGASNASSYKEAVNDTGSSGANNASAYRYAVNGTTEDGARHANAFKNAINNIGGTVSLGVNISVNVSGGAGAKGSLGAWHSPYENGHTSGMTLYTSTKRAYASGKTLMGELGPELVVSHGRYFLVGQNGPEMVDLDEDAIVFNHLQTQKLIQQGKINTHGSPVTNERKATSMATGNFDGPAMASASEVLAILKQLREMWRSLLKASMRDIGISAGKEKDKDSKTGKDTTETIKDDTETTEKYVDGIESKVERWYNWLQAIEETQYEINKLTKEYTLMEKQGLSVEKQLANLSQQYEKRRESAEIRQQLAKEQTAYRTDYINEANEGFMSAFYQADPTTGQVYLANDDAFQTFLKKQKAKGMDAGALGSTLADNGFVAKGRSVKRELTNNEKERLADEEVKQQRTSVTGILSPYYEYDKETGLYNLKDEKKAREAVKQSHSNDTKDVVLTRDIRTGADLMAELNATDAAGNLLHSAADQLAIIKAMGLWSQDLEANIDKSADDWEAQVVQRFFDKADEDKTEIESLTESIREQEQAALDDEIAMQEINEKIREAVKPVTTVTKELEKWYNETKRIQKVQEQINKLIKEMTLLQNDQKINGADIYNNLMAQADATKHQIALNEDLADKRRQENEELIEKNKNLPISIDEKTGLATFSEKKIGAVNGQTSVQTSYLESKKNEQGYFIDVNGNYVDNKGVLRNSAGDQIEGNFGKQAVVEVQGIEYDFANKTLPELIEDLNETDEYGNAKFNDQQKYQILEAAGYGDYMRYDETGNEIYNGTGEMTKDQMTQAVNAGVSRLQNVVDKINENSDAIAQSELDNLDLLAKLNEIEQQLIDNQINVEKMVKDAIVQEHQDAIDAKKDFRDALEKASQNTIDGLNESLNAERSMYERSENESELASLQRQLAVAQMSGGSMSEIQGLQEQIAAKQQEMYFTEREDLINKLDQSMQKQIEDLDAQIGIMEATLQFQLENGLLWGQVNEILSQTPEAIINYLITQNPEFRQASDADRSQQLKQIGDDVTFFKAQQDSIAKAFTSPITGEKETDLSDIDESIDDTKRAIDKIKDIVGGLETEGKDEPEVPEEQGTSSISETGFPGVDINQEIEIPKDWEVFEQLELPSDAGTARTSESEVPFEFDTTTGLPNYDDSYIFSRDLTITLTPELVQDDTLLDWTKYYEEHPQEPSTTQEAPQPKTETKTQEDIPPSVSSALDRIPPEVVERMRRRLHQRLGFDKGGDIDFTGPAWVDGTKNEPEHIFNFQQMNKLREHLLNGVDVTHQAVNGLSNIIQQFPNTNTYNNIASDSNEGISIEKLEFHMEVKEIANDYDARRAGEQAMEEIVRVARKSGTRSLSRR